jgi:hypothetical protein
MPAREDRHAALDVERETGDHLLLGETLPGPTSARQ